MIIGDGRDRGADRERTADDPAVAAGDDRSAGGGAALDVEEGPVDGAGAGPPPPAAYDRIADDYLAFVSDGLNDATSVLRVATDRLLEDIGSVAGLAVCDLGCGEGHLARRLAALGGAVVGVDVSPVLLARARERTSGANPRFVRDDALRLAAIGDGRFDLVVANLVLMDVPDLASVSAAVRRIIRGGGRFVLSIAHPCFQAPHADSVVGAEGRFAARCVSRYATEGFWRSTNPSGIRGRVGAHHRMLSTYVNALVAAGFAITRLSEPTLPRERYAGPHAQGQVEIPSVLVVAAHRP